MNRHGASILQTTINAFACAWALALVVTNCDAQPASNGRSPTDLVASSNTKTADFGTASASPDARDVAGWVLESGDNGDMSFVIIDKKEAKAFVFHPDGQLRGATPVLIGSAIGDSATDGIGQKKLSDIRPDERTTPAGRFVASLDRNLHGKEILWVDYDTAISLHPVVTGNARERRTQRLATPTALDNRISYGCINVSAVFFTTMLKPAFASASGIVYILPEEQPPRRFFEADRNARH